MKTLRTDTAGEILVTIPPGDVERVSDAIRSILELTGHKVRRVNETGDRLHSVEEVFPEANPAMALRGFRNKMDWTQDELAEKLGIKQNRVSDMESGRRAISKKMAAQLGELFGVSYKSFL